MAQNLQSEIILIAKLCGSIAAIGSYYFWIIKPLAIFNERQKQNHKLILEVMETLKKLEHDFTVLQTEHENETCKSKKRTR